MIIAELNLVRHLSRRLIIGQGKVAKIFTESYFTPQIYEGLTNGKMVELFQQTVMMHVKNNPVAIRAVERKYARKLVHNIRYIPTAEQLLVNMMSWNTSAVITASEWKKLCRSMDTSSQHILRGIVTDSGGITTDPGTMAKLITEWGRKKWAEPREETLKLKSRIQEIFNGHM